MTTSALGTRWEDIWRLEDLMSYSALSLARGYCLRIAQYGYLASEWLPLTDGGVRVGGITTTTLGLDPRAICCRRSQWPKMRKVVVQAPCHASAQLGHSHALAATPRASRDWSAAKSPRTYKRTQRNPIRHSRPDRHLYASAAALINYSGPIFVRCF